MAQTRLRTDPDVRRRFLHLRLSWKSPPVRCLNAAALTPTLDPEKGQGNLLPRKSGGQVL